MTGPDGGPAAVLITGGAGFIGSTVASACLDAGVEPVILDNLSTGSREFTRGRPFYEGDVADAGLLDRVFAEHPDIEAAVHCAALTIVPDSTVNPIRYYRENVAKTLTLIEGLARNGCHRLLFSSSASVYAAADGGRIDEDAPVRPTSPYGRTKAVLEWVLEDVAHAGTLRAIVLRYFNPIGADPEFRTGNPNPHPPHVLGRMIEAYENGETFHITGVDWPTRDGSAVRDFIHVWDLAQAHVAALRRFDRIVARRGRAGTPYEVINLGTGDGTTVRELADAFQDAVPGTLKVDERPRRPGDVPGAHTGVGKARDLLGWTPRLTVADGIRDALAWSRKVARLQQPDEPVVDLLMPYYGDVGLMQEAVRSVLHQDDPHWRLTVVDDGREPGVPEWFAAIAAEQGDGKVRYLRNEVNLGIAGNFQKCLTLVTEDLVTMVGCDDRLLPDYVGTVRSLLHRYPQASLAQPAVQVIDTAGQTYEPLVDRAKRRLYAPRVRGERLLGGQSLAVSLLRGNWMYFPAICWRAEAITSVGFDADFEVVQDLALTLEWVRAGAKIVLSDHVAFQYRRHPVSVSSIQAFSGRRFTEERGFFLAEAERMEQLGWERAARAARLHVSSRLHAATLLPLAMRRGSRHGVRTLATYAFLPLRMSEAASGRAVPERAVPGDAAPREDATSLTLSAETSAAASPPSQTTPKAPGHGPGPAPDTGTVPDTGTGSGR